MVWAAIGAAVIGVAGGAYQSNQRAKEAEKQRDWEDNARGITGGIAGMYSDYQNRQSRKDLEEMYAKREAEYGQYQNRLAMSYEDGGAGYLNSDEYKALQGIEDNRLTRRGSAAGRNANTTDQDILMQAHAQKYLGDYRTGLQNAMARTDPSKYNGFYTDAMTRQGNQGGGTFGGIGGIVSGARGIWDAWGNRPNSPETSDDPYGPPSSAMPGEMGPDYFPDDYSTWGNMGGPGD